MIKSRYTFMFHKGGDGDPILMNYLTGAIDMIDPSEVDELKKRLEQNNWKDYHLTEYLEERGYLFESLEQEEEEIQTAYTNFASEYETTPIQLVFSLTFACNFTCSYCYQEEYEEKTARLQTSVADSFFKYVNRKFGHEQIRPYITMFGGEPLLGGEGYQQGILYFLEKARDFRYDVAIVTNGYELVSYLPEFQRIQAPIKEIQVTLDGDRQMHDRRRRTKKGDPTFDRIAEGISMALRMGYRINLRTVVDRENMPSLPSLAQFALDEGWLNYPQELFETQLGRNYELHTCQKTDNLYNRVQMWTDFLEVAKDNPILHQYAKPQFHGIRYLTENGSLPEPLFDACPAGKREWAFDTNGGVYGCTASVGVPKYRLGSFLDENEPENEEQILMWETRDVLAIDECRDCAYSLSCGGGCGVLAANNNNGNIHTADCRPVKELLEVGAAYYGLGE